MKNIFKGRKGLCTAIVVMAIVLICGLYVTHKNKVENEFTTPPGVLVKSDSEEKSKKKPKKEVKIPTIKTFSNQILGGRVLKIHFLYKEGEKFTTQYIGFHKDGHFAISDNKDDFGDLKSISLEDAYLDTVQTYEKQSGHGERDSSEILKGITKLYVNYNVNEKGINLIYGGIVKSSNGRGSDRAISHNQLTNMTPIGRNKWKGAWVLEKQEDDMMGDGNIDPITITVVK